jgi:predicted phage terminase large subunit-like protein
MLAEQASEWTCHACGGHEQNLVGTCAVCWEPQSAPQRRFLSLTCREALYGGAAGGGKSDSLLVDAVRYVGRGYGTKYSALLLRREFPELETTLIARSWDLYPRLGGRYNEQKKVWRFPAGEKVHFGHLQHAGDVMQYSGAAFCFIGFDELTTFLESQYKFLISRLRSAHGIPLRLRGATNPGGEGHDWVFKRFRPWLDTRAEYDGCRAIPGEVVYFVRDPADPSKEYSVSRDEALCLLSAREAEGSAARREAMPHPLGRTFVPAKLEDNPFLYNDGEYARGLAELDLVTRERLRGGNWLIKPARGLLFRADWFQLVPAAPADGLRIRYWDRAATEVTPGKDPDWTVGVRMVKHEGKYYVDDVVRFRGSPAQVEARIKQTAELDGRGCRVGIEQDPGSAGKFEAEYYIRALAGYDVRAYPVTKDKVTRAQPCSAQAEAKNVCLVVGKWTEAFIQEAEQFPEGSHDDQVDALSGAFAALHAPPVVVGSVEVDWMSR